MPPLRRMDKTFRAWLDKQKKKNSLLNNRFAGLRFLFILCSWVQHALGCFPKQAIVLPSGDIWVSEWRLTGGSIYTKVSKHNSAKDWNVLDRLLGAGDIDRPTQQSLKSTGRYDNRLIKLFTVWEVFSQLSISVKSLRLGAKQGQNCTVKENKAFTWHLHRYKAVVLYIYV